MAATVTIDKAYFETLLRRAEFHATGENLTTPFDLPTVSILKCDHDNLLRMAQEYTTLREALYRGGIAPETLKILILGDNNSQSQLGHIDGNNTENTSGNFVTRPQSRPVRISAPSPSFDASSSSLHWSSRNHTNNGNTKERGGSYGQPHSFSHDDNSFPSDLEKDDQFLSTPNFEKQQYARAEQRTIIIKNLSERVTHKDVVDIIRGGAVLDIYLRSNEKTASVSFVEGSAAQAFMNYAKRNDIYIHDKRAEFVWNDRQFILPGHVASKIQNGSSRNLIIRGVHPNITADRIREDLDHIHNLVIIDITFQQAGALISLNSVHNSLFARTCMMSRGTYKGMRIEWYPDECARPLPKAQHAPRKENIASTKKFSPMVNRFQMLNIDGTEDGSESANEEDDSTGFTPIHHGTNWSAHTITT